MQEQSAKEKSNTFIPEVFSSRTEPQQHASPSAPYTKDEIFHFDKAKRLSHLKVLKIYINKRDTLFLHNSI